MNNKGMDRDIALLIASALETTGTLVNTINDNKYVAHITTQPTDQTGAIGDDVTFSLVANNVSAYQWQYKQSASGPWKDSTTTGYDTNSMTLEITSARLAYQYRCKVTGLDGNTVISDVVHMIEEVANG